MAVESVADARPRADADPVLVDAGAEIKSGVDDCGWILLGVFISS